jgi:hypothetical protein
MITYHSDGRCALEVLCLLLPVSSCFSYSWLLSPVTCDYLKLMYLSTQFFVVIAVRCAAYTLIQSVFDLAWQLFTRRQVQEDFPTLKGWRLLVLLNCASFIILYSSTTCFKNSDTQSVYIVQLIHLFHHAISHQTQRCIFHCYRMAILQSRLGVRCRILRPPLFIFTRMYTACCSQAGTYITARLQGPST